MTTDTTTMQQTTPALATPAEVLGLLPDAPMDMPRQILERAPRRSVIAGLIDRATALFAGASRAA